MSIASLPMYDLPELRQATDDWWQGLARALRREGISEVPDNLARADDDAAFWRHPDLFLSQTCGYPLMTDLFGDLLLLGTPCYDVPGCDGVYYRSRIIVGRDSPFHTLADLRGHTCALNNRSSHSGMNALRHSIAPLSDGKAFFGDVVISGGHRHSIFMVGRGEADVAAIDCVTWALINDVAPAELSGVRMLQETAQAPGLPLVTSMATSPDLVARILAAIGGAFCDADLQAARQALHLGGFVQTTPDDYEAILAMEASAAGPGNSLSVGK